MLGLHPGQRVRPALPRVPANRLNLRLQPAPRHRPGRPAPRASRTRWRGPGGSSGGTASCSRRTRGDPGAGGRDPPLTAPPPGPTREVADADLKAGLGSRWTATPEGHPLAGSRPGPGTCPFSGRGLQCHHDPRRLPLVAEHGADPALRSFSPAQHGLVAACEPTIAGRGQERRPSPDRGREDHGGGCRKPPPAPPERLEPSTSWQPASAPRTLDSNPSGGSWAGASSRSSSPTRERSATSWRHPTQPLMWGSAASRSSSAAMPSASSVVCAHPISAVIGHHQLRAELQHGRAGPRLHGAQRQPSSSLISHAVKPLEGGQDQCAPLFLEKPSHWLPQ
jgi:hypothetical protein